MFQISREIYQFHIFIIKKLTFLFINSFMFKTLLKIYYISPPFSVVSSERYLQTSEVHVHSKSMIHTKIFFSFVYIS